MRMPFRVFMCLLMLDISATTLARAGMGEEEQIRAVAAHWESAWNEHDMAALAALFTEDADFVNVGARHWTGRSEIERQHAARLNQFSGSTWETGQVAVRFLSPDISIAHVSWAMKGDKDPDGTLRPPREGVFTWVLVREGTRWLIRAAQNTNRGNLPAPSGAESLARTSGDAEKELLKIQDEWAAARVERNVPYLERLYAKEFRVHSMNGSVVERETDIANFATGALKPDYIKNEGMTVSVYGDAAIVTGIENVGGTYKGNYGEFSFRFTNVFVKRDDRWQLALHQSTPILTLKK